MPHIEDKRRFLNIDDQPTMPFVVEFADGQRGEAINSLYLMDLITGEYFADIDEVQTYYLVGVKTLRDLAASTFAATGVRALVYDGVGPFYDNGISRYKDEQEEEREKLFTNSDHPIILDGYDPWTVVASLIRAGYMKLWERYPVWSDKAKVQGCDGCIFKQDRDGKPYCTVWESPNVFVLWNESCAWVTNEAPYEDYHEVDPDAIIEASYKLYWTEPEKRTKEYIGLRPASPDKD